MLSHSQASFAQAPKPLTVAHSHAAPVVTLEKDERPREGQAFYVLFPTKEIPKQVQQVPLVPDSI
jgi:hypothetical protein